jgi:hypothetical protein
LSSVGFLLRDTRDRHATKLLLYIFRDLGGSASTRQIAYEGLVEVWQGFDPGYQVFMTMMERERRLGPESDKSWEDVIDWEFVRRVEGELENRP